MCSVLLLLLSSLRLVLLHKLSDEVDGGLNALRAAGESDDALVGRVGLRVADADVGAGLRAQVADDGLPFLPITQPAHTVGMAIFCVDGMPVLGEAADVEPAADSLRDGCEGRGVRRRVRLGGCGRSGNRRRLRHHRRRTRLLGLYSYTRVPGLSGLSLSCVTTRVMASCTAVGMPVMVTVFSLLLGSGSLD